MRRNLCVSSQCVSHVPPLIRRTEPEQQHLQSAFLGDELPQRGRSEEVDDEADHAKHAPQGKPEFGVAPGQESEHANQGAHASHELQGFLGVEIARALSSFFFFFLAFRAFFSVPMASSSATFWRTCSISSDRDGRTDSGRLGRFVAS